MSTLYDLFKLSENATQEQIKQAYDNIIKKADSLPENEKIIQQIRRVKIAYGILSNPEKREKYDFDLAAKRAQALLENVQIKEKQELVENKTEKQIEQERRIKQAIDEHLENIAKQQKVKQEKQNRTKERKEKRQAKKEAMLKKEREMYAYGAYLEKQGYYVKYPWTWLRIKRLLITIISIIIALSVMWQIPFVKQTLTDLYQENQILRLLVDSITSLNRSILEWIKNIFK